MSNGKTAFLSTLTQRFESGKSEKDMLHVDEVWREFVPHESSGPCYTYDPPFESDPGNTISLHMGMSSSDWDPNLQIFLHEKNKFFYSVTYPYNALYLDANTLKKTGMYHPRAKRKCKYTIWQK